MPTAVPYVDVNAWLDNFELTRFEDLVRGTSE
jgi:hypothetical protein